MLLAGVFVAALGAPGVAQAAQKWAVVNSAGTLVRGAGATAAIHLGTGTYQVNFSSNQTLCAYVATPGDVGAGSVSGPKLATVASRAGNTKGLFIQTFDQSSGALVDTPFHVQTFCGLQYYGVVASNGTLARGAHIVSTAPLGTGSYEVIFDKNVSKCAFTGSIGTTSTGSIPSPGQLTVAGRAGNVNGVFVRIVDRAGVSLDSSFHLSVNCGSSKLIGAIKVDGTKARGANVVFSQKLSATLNDGRYEVIFNRDVSGCSYTATIGTTTNGGSISTPVTITTATRAGNVNGVFLFIHKTDGTTIDEPFHLFVSCPVIVDSAPAAGDGSQDVPSASPAPVTGTAEENGLNR
jgi:hypothetical protein